MKLADAYGAEGYRITTEEELEELLPKALASPRTAVIDVLVDREEECFSHCAGRGLAGRDVDRIGVALLGEL